MDTAVDILAYLSIGAAALYALWAMVALVRGQDPREPFVIGGAIVEVLLVLLAVVSFVAMAVQGGPDQTALYVSYLIFTLLVLPVGLFWALAEKSRWGTSVLVFSAVVVAVLVVRLQEIWFGV